MRLTRGRITAKGTSGRRDSVRRWASGGHVDRPAEAGGTCSQRQTGAHAEGDGRSPRKRREPRPCSSSRHVWAGGLGLWAQGRRGHGCAVGAQGSGTALSNGGTGTVRVSWVRRPGCGTPRERTGWKGRHRQGDTHCGSRVQAIRTEQACSCVHRNVHQRVTFKTAQGMHTPHTPRREPRRGTRLCSPQPGHLPRAGTPAPTPRPARETGPRLRTASHHPARGPRVLLSTTRGEMGEPRGQGESLTFPGGMS